VRRPPAASSITVAGVAVEVLRKRIKNLHLRVYPPDGRVRVSAPLRMPAWQLNELVAERLPWILKQQERFGQAPKTSTLEYVSGEMHYFQGRPYRLELRQSGSLKPAVRLSGEAIELQLPAHARFAQRQQLLERWYRQQARLAAGPLLESWSLALRAGYSAWGIRQMKSRWGSCNPGARRVWLNSELIKRPPACLEYVVVHELAHLIVPDHSAAFWAVVERHLPGWRGARAELRRWPLWANGRLP